MGNAASAPRCRVCQAEHWSSEPHRFAGEVKVAPDRHVTAQRAQPRHVTACPDCDRHKARIAELEAQLDAVKSADAKRAKAYRQRRAAGKS